MQITDDMVDQVAKAIYERRFSLAEGIKPPLWDSLPSWVRHDWCTIARAGLEAASGAMTAQGTPNEITPDMVERGAQAIHSAEMPGEPSWAIQSYWQKMNEADKSEYGRRARSCLEAARIAALVHLCDTCAQTKCWTRRDIEDACEDALFPARAVVVECKAYVANEDVEAVAGGDEGCLRCPKIGRP